MRIKKCRNPDRRRRRRTRRRFCDETAASIITENQQGIPVVLSNIVSSQVDVHKEFGGVVPELAARSHMEKIDWIVQKAIDDSGRKIEEIDAVASTAGPGLIVCLSVGLSFGKAFASALDKPFIAVNHLEGHALSPKLNSKLNYPYLLLLISGGHSQYLNVQPGLPPIYTRDLTVLV